jgi:hypothetical protein
MANCYPGNHLGFRKTAQVFPRVLYLLVLWYVASDTKLNKMTKSNKTTFSVTNQNETKRKKTFMPFDIDSLTLRLYFTLYGVTVVS